MQKLHSVLIPELWLLVQCASTIYLLQFSSVVKLHFKSNLWCVRVQRQGKQTKCFVSVSNIVN